MKKIKIYKTNFLRHLFDFGVLTKLLNFYILIIAFISLLASINLFDIYVNPDFKILKPIFVYDFKYIKKLLENDNYRRYIDYTKNFKTLINNKNIDYSVCYYAGYGTISNLIDPVNPFEITNKNEKKRITGYLSKDIWYLYGINNSSSLVKSNFNFNVNRTDYQIINGLSALLSEVLQEELDSLISKYDSLNETKPKGIEEIQFNILDELYNLKNVNKESPEFYDFLFSITNNTNILSIISVQNKSSQVMDNISFYLNDLFYYGHYKLLGWTSSSLISSIDRNEQSLRFNINRLEPNQSIEIIFRGTKSIRENDIKLSLYQSKTINIRLVILILISTVVFLIIIYYFTGWRKLLKNSKEVKEK